MKMDVCYPRWALDRYAVLYLGQALVWTQNSSTEKGGEALHSALGFLICPEVLSSVCVVLFTYLDTKFTINNFLFNSRGRTSFSNL